MIGSKLHPVDTELLVRAGIDAILVNIDVVERSRSLIDVAERPMLVEAARGQLAMRNDLPFALSNERLVSR